MQPGSGRHIRAGMRVSTLCVCCPPPFLLNWNLRAVTGFSPRRFFCGGPWAEGGKQVLQTAQARNHSTDLLWLIHGDSVTAFLSIPS
jgi:hypothetical protein